ncbi:SUMF1/EgtB/PvdO family nonheme iron enzyme [Gimesia sp.]|uniref:SUMF1/EgtB/PvdO family nonheme iron enzyme n=1 Tax=Gimesia sp. TaxID=2024833 RepID=UPI003A90D937
MWLSDSRAANYAFLVGVKNYGQRSGLNALQYTENDVEELASLLHAKGYHQKNITVLTQTRSLKEPGLSPTRENILRELDLILKGLNPDDSVLLAFAGHGVKFKTGKDSYFCPIDTEIKERKHLISYATIYDKLKACPASHKLLLSDACRNDPLSNTGRSIPSVTRPEPNIPPGSTVALFACQAGQEAQEDQDLKHGVFFHYVLDGLRGAADRRGNDSTGNSNGTVELTELVAYTQQHVKDHVRGKFRTSQIPELQTHVTNIQQLIRYPVLSLRKSITNSIGMQLAEIPAGEFLMGSGKSAAEIARLFESKAENFADEHPQHRVKITKSFQMGVFEVTVGQFRQFVEATGYQTEAEKDGEGGYGWNETTEKFEGRDPKYNWKNTGFKQTDEHPVVNVTWNDAVAFCKWLSRQEGKSYRLPTEAEWEYACRGGTTSLYQTGDDPNGLAVIGNTADQTAKDRWTNYQTFDYLSVRDNYVFSSPVGSFRSNAFGLYDMHGNVWEWCQDWYGEDYYGKSPITDPSGPSSGSSRVLRGGSWSFNPQYDRSANRYRCSPDYCHNNFGFRVVCELY